MVTELWAFFNSHTSPCVNRVLQLAVAVISTFGRYLRNVGKAGRVGIRLAVHNRAAAYVVAGGGIFENQL